MPQLWNYLINMSFRTGAVSGKCAKVTILFRQGIKCYRDNCRLISILQTVSEVIESLVHFHLYGHLPQNTLFF